jgi:membrane-associated phospholipid phosphatase
MLMLLHADSGFIGAIISRIKLAFDAPSPAAFSPRLQPVIATPSRGSLPSGHTTEVYMLTGLLTFFARRVGGAGGDGHGP